MKILIRILLLPFIVPLYFLWSMYNLFQVMCFFVKYGGELEIYDKEQP